MRISQPEPIASGRLFAYMDRLAQTARSGVGLFGIVGTHVQVFRWAQSPDLASGGLECGSSVRLSSSPVGFLLLSSLGLAQAGKILWRLNAEAEPADRFNLAEANEMVARYGQLGHATGMSGFAPDTKVAAMLLPESLGERRLALGGSPAAPAAAHSPVTPAPEQPQAPPEQEAPRPGPATPEVAAPPAEGPSALAREAAAESPPAPQPAEAAPPAQAPPASQPSSPGSTAAEVRRLWPEVLVRLREIKRTPWSLISQESASPGWIEPSKSRLSRLSCMRASVRLARRAVVRCGSRISGSASNTKTRVPPGVGSWALARGDATRPLSAAAPATAVDPWSRVRRFVVRLNS